MQITKKEFIEKLYEIEEKENIKTGRLVQKVIRNEIIPVDVIKLVNKYDNKFLKIYDTYNIIYQSRNRNPLYRNLRNKYLKIEEQAIAISSLVTKILISCSKIKNLEERQIFTQAMNVPKLNEALTNYCVNNDSTLLSECASEVSDLLHILYMD